MNANGVIGRDGTTPWHYSADLKRFKKITLNSTVIMGRKTWDSLPFKPLPQRQNIVITRGSIPDVEYCDSISKALENAQNEQIWVIGGSEIYALAIDYCDHMDVTHIPDSIDGPDCAYFPTIDWSQWAAGLKTQYPDDERLFHQQFTR